MTSQSAHRTRTGEERSEESTPPEDGLAAHLRAANVDMLYERNFSPAVMGVPFGAMLVVATWDLLPHATTLTWFAAKIVTAIIRIGLHRAYRVRDATDDPRVWERRYLAVLFVDIVVWMVLGPYAATSEQLLILAGGTCSVIGVGAVGTVALSTHRLGVFAFVTGLLLPGAVAHFAMGTRVGLFAGGSLVAFYLLMLDHGRRASASTDELLRLRFAIAEARDEALAAVRAKSDFLATMSHELRTPLNAVLGMATLLGTEQLDEIQRSRVNVIQTSGEALLSIIGDILDFSKIESGKIDVERVPVPVVRCIEDTLQVVSAAVAEKGLDLGYELDADVPDVVLTDPTRLKQILLNLLTNAVKFTPSGGVFVRVSPGSGERWRERLAFAVVDTGIGISGDVKERLFAPFSQADASIVRRFGGTGLGLAICRRLCEALGGGISVESAPGQGSTFRFEIAAEPVTADTSVRPRVTGPARVFSDRPEIAARLSGLLVRLGLSASAASDSEPAPGEGEIGAKEGEVILLDYRDRARQKALLGRLLSTGGSSARVLVLVDPGKGQTPEDPRVRLLERPFRVDRFVATARDRGERPSSNRASRSRPAADAPLVLVVDDDAINRLVTVQLLRSLGYRASSAESGAAAIDAALSTPVDVVLMDLQMPDLDGDAATRMLLAAFEGKHPPCVIGLTASALAEDRKRCLSAGMIDYLVKPVRVEALTAALASSRPHWPPRAQGR